MDEENAASIDADDAAPQGASSEANTAENNQDSKESSSEDAKDLKDAAEGDAESGDESEEAPKVDLVAEFGDAPHPKKLEIINQLNLKEAREIFAKHKKLPEGYRRLINNHFEDVLRRCFPDHYFFYKKHDGVYYFEEIFHELERIKKKLDIKSREPVNTKSLRDTLDPDDFILLQNFIDAAATDDFSLIEDDIHRVRTYLFNDYLDIIRFCQLANLDFLKHLYEKMKENRLEAQAMREWDLISDDIKSLERGWKDWQKEQGSVNWLKFFSNEIKDILKLGTSGSFFALLDFLAGNRVNVVRHGPYLEELLNTVVQLKRYNLFTMLIEKFKITRFDWFSLLTPAANTGQIALVETLVDYEEKVRKVDRTDIRFSVMMQSVKNGYFEAFVYYFEQCSDEELKERQEWCQAIISAIALGDFEFFKFIYEHPLFCVNATRLEISYAETKDDDELKKSLKSLTPHERFIQKSLAFDMDSESAFATTKYLLEKYMKAFDIDTFLTFKSDEFDINKIMYLYKFVGIKKKYLSFAHSFFATDTNIRRFFFCFSFSAADLEGKIRPIVTEIHNSEYDMDKEAIKTYHDLANYADYFAGKSDLRQCVVELFGAYSKDFGKTKEHKEIVGKVLAELPSEDPPSAVETVEKIRKAVIKTGKLVNESGSLGLVFKVVTAKLGIKSISADKINEKMKKKKKK